MSSQLEKIAEGNLEDLTIAEDEGTIRLTHCVAYERDQSNKADRVTKMQTSEYFENSRNNRKYCIKHMDPAAQNAIGSLEPSCMQTISVPVEWQKYHQERLSSNVHTYEGICVHTIHMQYHTIRMYYTTLNGQLCVNQTNHHENIPFIVLDSLVSSALVHRPGVTCMVCRIDSKVVTCRKR